MLEALALANGAYQIIRQTIQNGRELTSAGKSIADFCRAEDQLQQDLHKRKNSMWTAFLGKTDNDLEEFMALEEIRRKKETLREFMQLYGRAGLYQDYLNYCSESRRKRKEALLAQKKKRQQMQDLVLKIILGILIAGLLTGVVTVLAIIAKKKGII
ncbi:MAG: hypothetical protein CBC44_004025 [Flavobacteriales bacterium TMED84]|nr:MAG: hypothetical protein CBC44_004025 [Flavobacteriales bacterium TMED84]